MALMQVILFLGHWFVYHTWVSFWPMSQDGARQLGAAVLVLSVSFVIAGVLGFRFVHPLVSLFYKVAASWLGILNFLFWGACLCWVLDLVARLAHVGGPTRQVIAAGVFGLALAVSIAGFINARIIRIRRVSVALPNLPESWRGRTALLFSDIHLGNVNGARYSRRLANLARRLNPDVIFIAGDLFDGVRCDAYGMAEPLFQLKPPQGMYFCGGNHEDFGDADQYFSALIHGGIRVLHNERVDVDGLQVIGVSYADASLPLHLRSFLDSLQLEGGPASVLLNHVPHRLPIVERAGVSLQLSGHTHKGQIFPFTWITRRAFGNFTYGLHRYGKLQVLTSSGVGTWGPPMRVGTAPELVQITFV